MNLYGNTMPIMVMFTVLKVLDSWMNGYEAFTRSIIIIIR